MTKEHRSLTDPSLHEPKGISTANLGDVYVADGAGSGVWTDGCNYYSLTAVIDDISTAQSDWVVAPFAGTIVKIYSVIDGAITGADANLSFEIGGIAITDGGIVIAQSGSAAGDVDSATPTATNTVTAGQAIELITDGASTNSSKATVTFWIKV